MLKKAKVSNKTEFCTGLHKTYQILEERLKTISYITSKERKTRNSA